MAAIEAGREIVSAAFITPYPPGFPVLVPGQIITPEIVQFLMALDVKEIHGYEHAFGLRVFTDDVLAVDVETNSGSQRAEVLESTAQP